ncbi:phytase [Spirosoma utsteinense]|uniref:3-phytase n=1 Tax=Spirosoma utsteinense TaxID=2585773 RepID=A0ABR6W632_9BACT|nr:phytase [Spirosoma utsteinense]MBC3785879.1 3-phytase [Spirosoma utsteinense]MBC3792051.1 3-phytase [Spirosoma utsteinense]
MYSVYSYCLLAGLLLAACQHPNAQTAPAQAGKSTAIKPVIITEPVAHDTDDPAIWVNPVDPAKSLVIGTDKDADGALYVFDLQGKIVPGKVVHNLNRPNNVDLVYGLSLKGTHTDVAVVTERGTSRIRTFRLPDMKPLDSQPLDVFVGEEKRLPMGIALYKRPSDGVVFAIVGRKEGPAQGYLWQYRLDDDGKGLIKATVVRKFGTWSGKKEIESIAVDAELGYVYYSDEGVGVRKYYADPERGDAELALFAKTGFAEDHEGISIYKTGPTTGYLLVSDQGANQFHVFRREGEPGKPNEHQLVKIVPVAAQVSDGSEVTNVPLGKAFPKGLFVAMSDDRTFHYYRWEDIAGKELK